MKDGPKAEILVMAIASNTKGLLLKSEEGLIGMCSFPFNFYVKDLEFDATVGVRKNLAKIIGESEELIKVGSMRAAFGHTQIVTTALSSKLADKLMKTSRMKIGWVSCHVIEMKQVARFKVLGT